MLAPLLPYLTAYAWPGNVRELENIADRIAVHLLQFDALAQVSYEGLREDCPELFSGAPDGLDGDLKARLFKELERNNGSRTLAAQKLGISRSTVWRWMKEQPDEER